MGFGHRVYRAEDPRARVLRRTAREIGSPRFEVAEALEQAALAELKARKPDRVLATNVEFWSAVVLDHAEVPADLFTSLFTCARVGGLVGAHPRAEARGAADPPDREVRRARRARGRLRQTSPRGARCEDVAQRRGVLVGEALQRRRRLAHPRCTTPRSAIALLGQDEGLDAAVVLGGPRSTRPGPRAGRRCR